MSYEGIRINENCKIRKRQQCAWCGDLMEVGEITVYRVYIFDGDFTADHMHLECYKAMRDCNDDFGDGFMPGDYLRGSTKRWDD